MCPVQGPWQPFRPGRDGNQGPCARHPRRQSHESRRKRGACEGGCGGPRNAGRGPGASRLRPGGRRSFRRGHASSSPVPRPLPLRRPLTGCHRGRAPLSGAPGAGGSQRVGGRAPGGQSGASGFTPLRRQKQTRSPRGPRGGSAVQKPLPPRPQRARERPAVSRALGRTRGVPVPRVRALRPAPAPCPQHGVLLTTSYQGRVRCSACKAYFSGPPKLR